MTTLPTPGRDQRRQDRFARARVVGLAVIVLLALVVIANVVLQDPTFVERISIVNHSDYDIRIDVGSDDGSRGMPLGVATQRCTTDFHHVIDQGPIWRIQFHAQGRAGGQVTVTRADLQRANWSYEIPDFVAGELTSQQTPLPRVLGCNTPPTTG